VKVISIPSSGARCWEQETTPRLSSAFSAPGARGDVGVLGVSWRVIGERKPQADDGLERRERWERPEPPTVKKGLVTGG
jgi:hypothetical protein